MNILHVPERFSVGVFGSGTILLISMLKYFYRIQNKKFNFITNKIITSKGTLETEYFLTENNKNALKLFLNYFTKLSIE